MTMEHEGLVREISRRVLETLGLPGDQERLLIFTKKEAGLPQSLEYLNCKNNHLVYVDEQWSMDRIDRFILPNILIDQMVDLAAGKGGGKVMYAVRQVLLTGKQVEVVEFEYKLYQHSAPATLYARYEEYRQILRTFGVIDLQKKQAETHRIAGGVLTGGDIAKLHKTGITCLEVSKECCVTPLAYEFAGDQSIRIHRISGG